MNAAPSPAVSPQLTEPWTRFAAWAADELGMRIVREGDLYRAEPDSHPTDGVDEHSVRKSWLRRRPKPDPAEELPEPITAHNPEALLSALIGRLADAERLPQTRPVEQPSALSEITERLFDAYKLDGGKARVTGCALEDAPFVRLSWVLTGRPDGDEQVAHAYYDERGQKVDPELARDLGLESVESYGKAAPKLAADILSDLIGSASSEFAASGALPIEGQATLVSLVWVKHASGHLAFEFGETSIDAAFQGWAATLKAPPVVCLQTGRKTFHLGSFDGTGEGEAPEIAAAEEIVVSDVTGRRRLGRDLLTCSVTGKRGEAEWFERSGVSGAPVLADYAGVCATCGMVVAENELTTQACVGCERSERLGAADPRLAAIRKLYPSLFSGSAASARGWTIAEMCDAYVLQHSGWFRRRVVTFDKETLEVRRAAQASTFSSTWRPIELPARVG